MALTKLFFSLDEIALNLADMSFYDIGSVHRAESGNWSGWEEAKQYLEILCDHVEDLQLRTKNDSVFLFEPIDNFVSNRSVIHTISDDPLEQFPPFPIDTKNTKIGLDEIKNWCLKHNLRPSFLFSDSPNPNSELQSFEPHNDLISELALLLKGEHQHQAEELKIAINAWYQASLLIRNSEGSKSYLKLISTQIEKISPKLSKATLDRIAKVSNWNKKGNGIENN
ncbi:hypothetical protein [Shewanella holmiensis]|uniref:Uncharacterized protein n=1 Tax=Shewanella holmiensis TaxID=2952222 RepID=A0A9X3AVY0_9GAMM|nr:hypothetical protein [Shewanella holmiensis]MCT7943145.1 hypothetical protein [Shewanella holmiensis]